jgi:sulfatase modifying factor 1
MDLFLGKGCHVRRFKMMKKKLAAMAVLTAAVLPIMALDNVEVVNVTARQRYPWNGLVDINFELDSKTVAPYQMKVTVFDNVGKTNLPVRSVFTPNVSMTNNPCMVTKDTTHIIWNAAADLPDGFKCTNVSVTVQDARAIPTSKLYCVIDLSGGSNATKYAVSYLDSVPPGGWSDEYKTTKLVLRRVEPGTFMMGSPDNDAARQTNEDYHQVRLTTPYYIGIFETTEAQAWCVLGSGDSTKQPTRLSYERIRGAWRTYNWPTNTTDVDPVSFAGKLRVKTGITTFDLPTEAQWEYAARGGCCTALYSGLPNTIDNLNAICRSQTNRLDGAGGSIYLTTTTTVGNYAPNALGLYDMLGNAEEWCVDGYQEHLGTSAVTDPKGGPVGSNRVTKGGGYGPYLTNDHQYQGWFKTDSVVRRRNIDIDYCNTVGFRIIFTIED